MSWTYAKILVPISENPFMRSSAFFPCRVTSVVVLCITTWLLCGCKTSLPWNHDKAENTTNTLFAALPARLPENPNTTQICQAVNENASRIGSLRSGNATLSIAQMGLPSMKTQFAYQTPRRMRITGSVLSAAGTAFDLGSNEDRFWFWVQGDPNVQYCRYDDYARVAASGRLLVDPKLIFEGLGVEQLGDDEQIVAGPITTSGLLAIQTQRPETSGVFTKWTYIDPRQGVPVYHVVQNALGQTIASVISKDFTQDMASGALVPRRLEIAISLPEGGHYVLELNMQDVAVNQSGVGATAWEMPSYSNTANPIDLAVGIQPTSGNYSAVAPMSLQMPGSTNPSGTGTGMNSGTGSTGNIANAGNSVNASNSVNTSGSGGMGGAMSGNAYAASAMSPNGPASQTPVVATGSVTGWPSMSVAPNSYDAPKYAAARSADATSPTATGANSPNPPANAATQGTTGRLPDFDLTGTPDFNILPEEVAGAAANSAPSSAPSNHPADPFLTATPPATAGTGPSGTPIANAANSGASQTVSPLNSLPPPPPESLTVNRMTGTIPVNPSAGTNFGLIPPNGTNNGVSGASTASTVNVSNTGNLANSSGTAAAGTTATGAVGTKAVVWNSSDTVWESSDVDPLVSKRRTLVPNRVTPPSTTGPTATSTPAKPEVVLPAGVTRLW
ncbi:MAG: hypothetical protein PHE53_04800 [Thermoguttaceae bacterium]|nr:hypothetical protein [Thermoguttaceae bacterium]